MSDAWVSRILSGDIEVSVKQLLDIAEALAVAPASLLPIVLWVRGKRIRRSLGTDEYYLALDRARDITAELRKPLPTGTPIAAFLDQYRTWAKETKPSSYRTEDYRLKVISAWLYNAGLSVLEDITPYHVEQMRAAVRVHDRRAKDDGPFKDKESSKATVNRYASLLRTVLNKAREWGLLKNENIFTHVKFYRESPEVRPLSDADVAAIMAAARTIAQTPQSDVQRLLPDLLALVLNTGLRRSEALRLRWSDVIDDELRIRGKGGKVRMVPINAEVRRILKSRPRLTAFVFDIANRDEPGVLRRLSETITRKTGIHFNIHLLRHLFASRLLAAGVDVVTISQLLGHSAFMTTLLYSHSNPRLTRKAVNKLASFPPGK